MKTYRLSEMPFLTIQGEGGNSGKPMLFIRFTGCSHRCTYCDTSFDNTVWEGSASDLVAEINKYKVPWVSFCGGEPGLQLDRNLVSAVQATGRKCSVETNGYFDLSDCGLDWIVVSPKNPVGGPAVSSDWIQRTGNDLKVLFPIAFSNELFFDADGFDNYWVSPVMDGEDEDRNIMDAIEFVKANPKWRLNCQIHKFLNFP